MTISTCMGYCIHRVEAQPALRNPDVAKHRVRTPNSDPRITHGWSFLLSLWLFFSPVFSFAKVGEANMDLLIGGQKGLVPSNSNLIRSRVVMFADLPGFKVNSAFESFCFVLESASMSTNIWDIQVRNRREGWGVGGWVKATELVLYTRSIKFTFLCAGILLELKILAQAWPMLISSGRPLETKRVSCTYYL